MKRFTKLTPALALFASVGLLAGCATSQSTTSSSTPAPASSSAPTSSSSTPTPTPVDPWAVPSDYVAFDATKDPKAFTAEIDWWDTFGSSGATASASRAGSHGAGLGPGAGTGTGTGGSQARSCQRREAASSERQPRASILRKTLLKNYFLMLFCCDTLMLEFCRNFKGVTNE